ncbi:hypothetical protein K7X08_026381 [Anisodus acutangulus]|uniref:Uncharacterized protein n=1 Tax=Anisodus acutangulus TaxID=402998 RepID=A0A9Q1R443_9SOLA|nr:hypothetical protein K7X08_026381 [Anisodus acutangulus]
MDRRDRPKTLWKRLKRRLRFNGLGACCGPSWNTRVSDVAVEEEEEAQYYGEEEPIHEAHYGSGRVNLAMLELEAERMGSLTPTTQFKTLMRLFEETDGRDEKKEEREIDTKVEWKYSIIILFRNFLQGN